MADAEMEPHMYKKLLTIGILVSAMSLPLFAAGCTSTAQKPYSVTGEQKDESLPPWKNPRYLDDKGHYKPWAPRY
jgi:hypothetical protein